MQADGVRLRDVIGNLLANAIARDIVAAHDGTIAATSSAGAGTTVTVTLPIEPR